MKKDLNIEMGARVKEKRKELCYTREALAELVDISPQFLANIESGKKGMSFTTLKKICQCTGTSCDYIIMGKSPDGKQDRIYETLANVDRKYLPLIERVLDDTLRIITEAEKSGQ